MAPTSETENDHSLQPLFSFGVITDVQYADIPDGRSYHGASRYYRKSLLVLQRAVQQWNGHKKISFCMHLGDIVDGYCPPDQSLKTVQKVVDEFDRFNGPVYHMIGNHCLYNLPRKELIPLLKMPSSGDLAYYDFSPCPEYRIVVLDAYDISALGWPQDHPNTHAALEILKAKNPNAEKDSPAGLSGFEKRFVKYNGAVGKQQLDWLDDVLRDSTEKGQKVIVCSHVPLDPGATADIALLWNYDEVMDVIHRYGCVKACFAGHHHNGGYSVDSHGIHHRVLEAVVECHPGSDAYGHVDVYHDRLSLVGADGMESNELFFRNRWGDNLHGYYMQFILTIGRVWKRFASYLKWTVQKN